MTTLFRSFRPEFLFVKMEEVYWRVKTTYREGLEEDQTLDDALHGVSVQTERPPQMSVTPLAANIGTNQTGCCRSRALIGRAGSGSRRGHLVQ